MKGQTVYAPEGGRIDDAQLKSILEDAISDCRDRLKKVLLLIPDYTRYHSNGGKIANILYHLLQDTCQVDLLEALGTHQPMTPEQIADMYGDIPQERFIAHNWRTDVVKIGVVPADFVSEVSEGVYNEAIDVEVSRHLYEGYDLILSIGQVVPHEVVGMASHSKNVFVGCGGSSMINSSHMLGAFYGMERIMGRDHSPVRQVFDYAEQHFLGSVPLGYILTVTTNTGDGVHIHGLFCGRERSGFEQAVAQSAELNFIRLDRPIKHCVVYLDPREFKSTWLGNKAVYRTRLAMADGGELTVLAPGVERFGEDEENDRLIRKYGYVGRENVLRLVDSPECDDLRGNLSVAAHLIHGSSDGRFNITYCTEKVSEAEVRGVCFDWQSYAEAAKRYDPAKLTDGWNTAPDGEEFYYISNPALGLWSV